MKRLCDLADRYGVTISLQVEGNSSRLKRYYKTFGFVIVDDGEGDVDVSSDDVIEGIMVRRPRKQFRSKRQAIERSS